MKSRNRLESSRAGGSSSQELEEQTTEIFAERRDGLDDDTVEMTDEEKHAIIEHAARHAPSTGATRARPPSKAVGGREARVAKKPAVGRNDLEREGIRREDGRVQHGSIEISGEEAAVAEHYTQPEPTQDATEVVVLGALSHECRMCGLRIAEPRAHRLRSGQRKRSFLCDTCHNVFCSAHVVRVSGLLTSLLKGGVYRCQLCHLDRRRAKP